jgi:hypothetical protein
MDMAGSMYAARARAVCSLRERKSPPLGRFFSPRDSQPVSLQDVFLKAYGPVRAILWWEKGYKESIYLVTNVLVINVESPQEACNWYKKRFRIETFFSDHSLSDTFYSRSGRDEAHPSRE